MLYKIIQNQKLSVISLGTAPFGSRLTESDAFSIIDAYYDNGGNLLDTARIYSNGHSEEIVGNWIKHKHNRDKIFVSTKGAHPNLSDWLPRVSENDIILDIEKSLSALQTDYIDIYYLHRDNESKDVSEIMTVLHQLVTSGKVRFLGASNWTIDRIQKANAFAKQHNLTPFTFSQIMWNAAKINPDGIGDKTLIVMNEKEYNGYLKTDLPIMAYTSQAQGLFSYLLKSEPNSLPEYLTRQYVNETTLTRAKTILQIAKETTLSPTAISLSYLINNKVTALPIIGVSSVERLRESLQVLDLPQKYQAILRKI